MAVKAREGVGRGALGVELSWRIWEAPDPKASLLIIHGLGEHSGRYGEFAGTLAGEGVSVFSFDLRGHGRSPGPRGDVDAFPRFLEDLLAMEGVWARETPTGIPRFLLGHSMGGLIGLRRLQVSRGPYAGAAFSAPWLATPLPRWLRGMGRLLGLAAPGIPIPAGLGPGRLTRDPQVARTWRDDPLIHTRITGRLFREAERAQEEALRSRVPEDLPLLFLVPSEDRIASSPATLGFARGIVGMDVRVEILEGRLHEPLNDLGREEVYSTVLDWLGHCMGMERLKPRR